MFLSFTPIGFLFSKRLAKSKFKKSKILLFFNPIKLHRLNIQLWAVNNELYDTNNSDLSFEFEITMLKNKKLLM